MFDKLNPSNDIDPVEADPEAVLVMVSVVVDGTVAIVADDRFKAVTPVLTIETFWPAENPCADDVVIETVVPFPDIDLIDFVANPDTVTLSPGSKPLTA